MDVLAQRKDPSGMKQGHVLLDGEPAPKDIRLISGYVVQVVVTINEWLRCAGSGYI